MKLRDATVAVTGGAGGIGRALGRAFGRAGARVRLVDLDPERLREVRDEVARTGADVEARTLDVTDEAACHEVFGALGDLDVLVNNAGVSHRSLFADTDPAVVRRVMDVNFFGAVHCTRAALPGLVRRRGAVVAMSSVAGFAPLVGRTAYAASKHALHGFFDTLRTEVARNGVRVAIVCPSYVATDFDTRHLSADGSVHADRRATVGKALSADEVAEEVVRVVRRGARSRLISPVAHASLWLSRLAPGVYDRLMLRGQGGEFFG
ncbi:MAG: SDR family oxidoreductase [Myxococcota bacterium]